jgi:hypothetical protein
MKDYKYSIDLFLKDESNADLGAVEFSKASELPKKLFDNEFHLISLHYKEDEEDIANQHCTQLNQVIRTNGFQHVEFRIRECKMPI